MAPRRSEPILIQPERLIARLWLVAALLGAAHLIAAATLNVIGYERAHELGLVFVLNQFNLDEEMNLPTYYSSSLLALAGVLLMLQARLVGRAGGGRLLHWRALAVGFCVMSFDEFAGMHERVGSLVRLRLHVSEFHGFRVNWIVVGLPLIVTIGCAYLPFLQSLHTRLRNSLISAGAVYVAGLVGMEILSTRYARLHGEQNMTYACFCFMEEMMEMAGVILLIRAIARELGESVAEWRIVATSVNAREPVRATAATVHSLRLPT